MCLQNVSKSDIIECAYKMYLYPILSNVPTKCIYIRYYRTCLQNDTTCTPLLYISALLNKYYETTY